MLNVYAPFKWSRQRTDAGAPVCHYRYTTRRGRALHILRPGLCWVVLVLVRAPARLTHTSVQCIII